MLSSVDCKGICANLVGCVAVRRNPVCAHNNCVYLALRHQRCSCRVHNERGWQAVMDQLICSQSRPCTSTHPSQLGGALTATLLPGVGTLSCRCHKSLAGCVRHLHCLAMIVVKWDPVSTACKSRSVEYDVTREGWQHLGCMAASLCSRHERGCRSRAVTARRPVLSRRPLLPGFQCCSGSAYALCCCWIPWLSARP